MKVLLINSVYGQGSTGRILVDIYSYLKTNNEECKIIYGRGKQSDSIDANKIGNNVSFANHILRTRVFDSHGFSSDNETLKIIQYIKEWNPDIIHLHNIHGYYLNVQLLFNYLKTLSTPIVWTLHDCWPITGHCAYFDYVKCDKWQDGCYECPQKKTYPKSNIIDNSHKNYAIKKELFTLPKTIKIVTPSYWLKDILSNSYLAEYDVEVIHNGVDQSIFKPTISNIKTHLNINEKKLILGVANIWEPRKGLKFLIELSSLLSDDYVIVIVGIKKSQMKLLNKNMIGIEKTANIVELAELYSAADIFVNPTLEDNFPTTNIEALSCGTPVITFNTGGSPESLDNSCGIVTSEKSARALKDAIEELNSDTQKCLQRAKIFDKNYAYHEYYQLYKTLIVEQRNE